MIYSFPLRINSLRMTLNRRTFLQQAGFGSLGLGLISFTPGCQTTAPHPAPVTSLPRSTPEAEGVASSGIQSFLDAIAQSKHEFHSFMLVRHGNVIAEGWWAPYGPRYVHTMYSMSKSFTSTAVGFAVKEGRLSVDENVLSFFPESRPAQISENLAALRVKDLLTMSVGNEKEPTGAVVQSKNWVETFLAQPITHKPGTVFLYNSAATYMCSAIVQKVTGKKVIDYLRPRLFEPLGISGMTWEECPRGINTGGWGLSIQTEGLAKFGQLYLQKGVWQGRQILPAAWVEEATTFKIQQPLPAKPARPNAQNDWLQGYAYQFWRCQHHGFRGDGAFGQFTIVLPEQDVVIAITSESPNMQGQLDLVWEHLLPAIKPAALPPNPKAMAALQQTLSALNVPGTQAPAETIAVNPIKSKSFKFDANSMGFNEGSLELQGANYVLTLKEGETTHLIHAAATGWTKDETTLPAPRLIGGGAPKPGTRHKITNRYLWLDAQTVAFTLRYYETPHHDTITCKFEGDKVTLTFLNSIFKLRNAKDTRPVITGRLVA
jgi:CubicO group peptidase (beta-lactamase class C family)